VSCYCPLVLVLARVDVAAAVVVPCALFAVVLTAVRRASHILLGTRCRGHTLLDFSTVSFVSRSSAMRFTVCLGPDSSPLLHGVMGLCVAGEQDVAAVATGALT
jgi:hypothetical protein